MTYVDYWGMVIGMGITISIIASIFGAVYLVRWMFGHSKLWWRALAVTLLLTAITFVVPGLVVLFVSIYASLQ